MGSEQPTAEEVRRNSEALVQHVLDQGTALPRRTRDAAEVVQHLCDAACEVGSEPGLERVVELCGALERRRLTPEQRAWLLYTQGNAWSGLDKIRGSVGSQTAIAERPDRQKAIVCYRRAMTHGGAGALPDEQYCPLVTNLGNEYFASGRFVEAIACYDRAIERNASFGMALGSRASSWLTSAELCARCGYDGQAAVLLRCAVDGLEQALREPMWPSETSQWAERLEHAHSMVPSADLLTRPMDLSGRSLGQCPEEVAYRSWGLAERLFLNPLNDLGGVSIAAHDCLLPPPAILSRGDMMGHLGLFNHMKQEFVAARFLAWSGLQDGDCHWADRHVALLNTLDYPAYGLRVEMLKLAFRSAYSILDKMAVFLNRYLRLGIPDRRVAFRSLWYKDQGPGKGVRPDLGDRSSWALQGLFWLAKDLGDTGEWQECIEPDAREVSELRNHAEHRYLKLHFIGPDAGADGRVHDRWAHSVSLGDFAAKTLALLRRVRAALMYLCFAIHDEERRRARDRPADSPVLPLCVDPWEDEWKK